MSEMIRLGRSLGQLHPFFKVGGLNGAGMAARFAGLVVIAQFVPPAEYGIYAAFTALSLAIVPIVTLRFEHAIPLTKSPRQLALMTGAVVFVSLIVSLLIGIAAVLAALTPLREFFGNTRLAHLAFLLAPYCFLLGIIQAFNQALLGSGKAVYAAVGRIVRAAMVVAFQLAAIVAIASSAQNLIVGEIIGLAILVVFLNYGVNGTGILRDLVASAGARSARYVKLLKRYAKFALVGVPHMVTHQALMATSPLVVGAIFGVDDMGHYFFMRQVVFGSLLIVTQTTYQIGVGEAAKIHADPSALARAMRSTFLIVGFASASAALIAALFGPELFELVFKDEWRFSGSLAAAVWVAILLEPIAASLAFVPAFLERQGLAFAWSAAQNLVGLGTLVLVGGSGATIEAAVSAASLASGTVIAGFLIWLWLSVRGSRSLGARSQDSR